MSVIVGRALLYVMASSRCTAVFCMRWTSSATIGIVRTKKSARIVGDVIGKYHPHGDSAVYDTIVRMAQDFSLRYPLVDGQGNFGSIDGDRAAAMQNTPRFACSVLRMSCWRIWIRTRLITSPTTTALKKYQDVDQIPNLLVNGGTGIAVGMATNIPPHNLGEVLDACLALIDQPDCSVETLMEHIKAPDFPQQVL